MNEAFEKILERLSNIDRVVKTYEDVEWNRAIYKSAEIVHEVAEEYNKAIDDFTEKMVIMMPGHMQDIERIAEQLKAGEENE